MPTESVSDVETDPIAENEISMRELMTLVERDPTSPKVPDWLFRYATLAEENAVLEAERQGSTPDVTHAKSALRRVVTGYPYYSRIDEVRYHLGRLELKSGDESEGLLLLDTLIEDYPHSVMIDAARELRAAHGG